MIFIWYEPLLLLSAHIYLFFLLLFEQCITHSPFQNRCSYLHDPATMSMESNVVTLPVKAKKHNGDAVVDPLFHEYRTVIHRKNSIIPTHIWEKCRPSRSSTHESKAFEDTYALACNNTSAVSNVLPTASVEHDLEEELTKLCIVNKMVGTRHKFTYDPQHSKCLPRCSYYIFVLYHVIGISNADQSSVLLFSRVRSPQWPTLHGSSYRILPTIGHCQHRAEWYRCGGNRFGIPKRQVKLKPRIVCMCSWGSIRPQGYVYLQPLDVSTSPVDIK